MQDKDLYAVLAVPRTASTNEIKKAYRKLARKCHPDLNPGNREAEERFKEISRAHEILTDPEKRKIYDEFGMAAVESGMTAEQARAQREQAGAWRAARGAGPSGPAQGFAGYTTFEDIFGDIFGERGERPGPQRGPDFEHELQVDFLDAVRGLATSVTLSRPEPCAQCHGGGMDASSGVICAVCNGSGRVQMAKGPVAFSRTCQQCGGVGRTNVQSCPRCNGSGHTTQSEQLNIRIPPGVDSASRVRVAGKGGGGTGGGPRGDLFIRVQVKPHPLIERRGADLYMDVPITVGEAIAGAAITVPTPDGNVRVQIPPGSQSGRHLRIKGHGVPHLKGKSRGDLYLRLMIHVPVEPTEEIRAEAKRIDAAFTRNPRENLKL